MSVSMSDHDRDCPAYEDRCGKCNCKAEQIAGLAAEIARLEAQLECERAEWQIISQNNRRHELIDKKFLSGLAAEEASALEKIDSRMDEVERVQSYETQISLQLENQRLQTALDEAVARSGEEKSDATKMP